MSRDPTVPVNLTTTTPVGPVPRPITATQATDRVERLRYWRRGGGQNPADWPDLKLWLKANEGSGNTLIDSSDSPIASGFTRVDSGTHDPWVATGFELSSTDNPTNFSQASALRAEIDKIALIGSKAVMMEFYGYIETFALTSTKYLFSIGDFTGTDRGYAMRVVKSGSNWRVVCCAGGDTATNRTNDSGVELVFPIGTVVHLAAFFAGGLSTVAGAGINGTTVYKALNGAPGVINVSATAGSGREARLGAVGSIPSVNTEVCPAIINEFRIWTFDALPADLPTIISEMYANPTSLPGSLKTPTAGAADTGYPIGAEFS